MFSIDGEQSTADQNNNSLYHFAVTLEENDCYLHRMDELRPVHNSFQRQVQLLDDKFATESLPERFSNEVYLSCTKVISTSYVSPFSIKYVREGCDFYKVNGISRILRENDVMITNSESFIELIGDSKKSKVEFNTGMSIFLGTRMVSDVLSVLKEKDIPECDGKLAQAPVFYDDIVYHDRAFKDYIRNLYANLNRNTSIYLSDEFYYEIVSRLIDFHDRTVQTMSLLSQKRSATKKEIIKRLHQAEQYIRESGNEQIDLDSVARTCCLSKFFLIRSFKDVFGITPHQFQIRNKIEASKNLLKQGKTVSEVAETLNYPSIQSFSRQFKQHTGSSPVRYKGGLDN